MASCKFKKHQKLILRCFIYMYIPLLSSSFLILNPPCLFPLVISDKLEKGETTMESSGTRDISSVSGILVAEQKKLKHLQIKMS